jgi:hypothetical protein
MTMHYTYGEWSAQLDRTLCGRWLHFTRSTYDPICATCETCLRVLARDAFTGPRHAEELVRRCVHRSDRRGLHDAHAVRERAQ